MILDTNVVSELMRRQQSAALVAWLDRQDRQTLWTTSVTVAEIYFGLRILPDGKRRQSLLAEADATFRDDFEGRILDFDQAAAKVFADLAAARRAIGRPLSMADGYIAAIAVSRRLAVVTRNA